MNNIIISGFSDEICENFEEQLENINNFGVTHIEIRGINGKGIIDLDDEQVEQINHMLHSHNVKISSMGSPIGKIKITEDFEQHFENFKNVVKAAKVLGTQYIRMFSFFLPEGEDPAEYRDEVIARLKTLIAYAKEENVILLHENEKGIYGDNADRCLDLMKTLSCENFKAVFDFANFVQVEQDTMEAYTMLKPYIAYIHVKDSVGMNVVPSGMGTGRVKEIFGLLKESGYSGFLSLEPHLANFSGFAKLENSNGEGKKLADGKFAWNIALNSLKAILYDLNWR